MLDELVTLTDAATSRCDYADARWVVERHERLGTRLGEVEEVVAAESEGVGVRVRVGGTWGFAATRDVSRAGLEEALARALRVAESLPRRAGMPLTAAEPARGHWAGACERDPFAMSVDERLAVLLEADAAMRATGDRRLVRTAASANFWHTEKAFASSEGAACTQTWTDSGAGLSAWALEGDELQSRGYPSFHGGHTATAGWEHVVALDLVANAARVASEAVELLTAPECPAGETTLVLHPEQLALQIHESIGHALELDRILGGEASYAGTSWVRPADFGALRYGSELLNVTADSTLPGALGSFGWDDEGVPGARVPLIRDGVLQGALSSRESAAEIGLATSAGCMRAEGFARQPIVRMTNVSIDPGEAGTLEDIIAATDDGIYMETNKSWSIDDRRLSFQFGTEVAREIRGGELGRLFRNPTYAGLTPDFWGSLDAVGSASSWDLWGLTNCGKGEPGQTARVSHGAAPARFRGVQVGVASR